MGATTKIGRTCWKLLKKNLLFSWHLWPYKGKRTLMAFRFLTAFRLQAVCQPFKRLGHLFERNIRLVVENINLFEQLSCPFIRNIKLFQWLGSPIRWRHQAVQMTRSPVHWRHQAVRTAWSPIIASLWIFCRMTWKMSYAEFHLFEPSSQCFQHLFDFICTILSALNSYFTLLKQRLYTSNCGTQAFRRWRSLIGWKN